MDCCENTKQKTNKKSKENTKKESIEENMKGGKDMETKNIMLWAVIGILLMATIFLTVKASSLGAQTSGSASGSLDTTGWTANEIMNYEMHGTVPARVTAGSNSAPASGGMVGGC